MIGPFQGKYRFLSNFYSVPVRYQGITFASSEHAYQCAKFFGTPHWSEALEYFAAEIPPSPSDAKKQGRKWSRMIRADWDDVKVDVMESILRSKFSSKEMREKLLETGGEHLVEVNDWHDRTWGMENIGTEDRPNFVGANCLGKLLMKIRLELKKRRVYGARRSGGAESTVKPEKGKRHARRSV